MVGLNRMGRSVQCLAVCSIRTRDCLARWLLHNTEREGIYASFWLPGGTCVATCKVGAILVPVCALVSRPTPVGARPLAGDQHCARQRNSEELLWGHSLSLEKRRLDLLSNPSSCRRPTSYTYTSSLLCKLQISSPPLPFSSLTLRHPPFIHPSPTLLPLSATCTSF